MSCLVVGCTGLNPLFADADGGEATGTPSSTTQYGSGQDSTDTGKDSDAPDTTASTGKDDTGDSTGPDDTGVGPGPTDGQTTGPDPATCSTYVQDCTDPNEKCMPWADGGGDSWNALGCFPLDAEPGTVGDECSVEGSVVSGLDDCDETSMCWDVDNETGTGTCVAFCQGDEATPLCEDPETTCVQRSGGVVAICLDMCSPLFQDCPGGQACVPFNEEFVCVPSAADEPQVGGPCATVNECGVGSVCIASGALVDCASPTCCTSFCNLAGDEVCEAPAVCVPWYAEGSAPPGYEDVGVCGAPE